MYAYFLLIHSNHIIFRSKFNKRCIISGRSRGVYNKYGLSRSFIKKFSNGILSGIRKASW